MFRVILGMSTQRKILIEYLEGVSKEVMLHLAKCAMYQDTLGRYDHWIHELSTWVVDGANMTCKPSGKKLKPVDYEDTIFRYIGTSVTDAIANLHELQRYNKRYEDESYPHVEIDDNMITRMFDAGQALAHEASVMMASASTYTLKYMQNALHDILDSILIDKE